MTDPAGVDGCRAGWVVASGDPRTPHFEIVATFREVLELGHRPLAVDMPIGLPRPGQKRACDRAARRALGRRACCVFSAPPRALLEARDYEAVRGLGLTIQSFHLLPKIREIDSLIGPSSQSWLKEAHPELVFWRLNGREPVASKKTREGREQRRRLLGLGALPTFARKSCSPDDLLDAAALLRASTDWGNAPPVALDHPTERDARGLVMEICY